MIRRGEKASKEEICSIGCFKLKTRCSACFSDYAHTSRIQEYLYSGGMYFRGIAAYGKFQKKMKGTSFRRVLIYGVLRYFNFPTHFVNCSPTSRLVMLWPGRSHWANYSFLYFSSRGICKFPFLSLSLSLSLCLSLWRPVENSMKQQCFKLPFPGYHGYPFEQNGCNSFHACSMACTPSWAWTRTATMQSNSKHSFFCLWPWLEEGGESDAQVCLKVRPHDKEFALSHAANVQLRERLENSAGLVWVQRKVQSCFRVSLTSLKLSNQQTNAPQRRGRLLKNSGRGNFYKMVCQSLKKGL